MGVPGQRDPTLRPRLPSTASEAPFNRNMCSFAAQSTIKLFHIDPF